MMTEAIRDLVEPCEFPSVLETADALVPLLYDDVRRLARRQRHLLRGENTMQTTALIHEAYLKLRGAPGFNDRGHFLRASALAMRHILVNHARGRLAGKRGGGAKPVSLSLAEEVVATAGGDDLVVDVNEALVRLAALNLRLARVVECRFFAGFSDEETALALGVTDRTVRRDWIKARAWLRRELDESGRDEAESRPLDDG
jgi:RNA polymerase sigma factor (TIGR02999 family)